MRTECPRQWMAAIPSCAPGVGCPFVMVSPVHPKLRYRKPSGSASNGKPVVSSSVGTSGP